MRSKGTDSFPMQVGFTLVELLVVIAIISVISAIALPIFTKYRLRGYKAALDADGRNVYIAAQAYLTDNMATTVDTIGKLNSGGYIASTDINFVNGSLSATSGKIELYSQSLNAQNLDNNSIIFYNGRIDQVNSPH